MTRFWLKCALLFCCLLSFAACAANARISEEFEKSVKNYNKMLRWQETTAAGMSYMVPEKREEFLHSAERFKKQGVSITDYRILSMECAPEKGRGDAVTEFDYYILPSNRIKTLSYTEEWVYKEFNGDKSWKLKSPLPLFE